MRDLLSLFVFSHFSVEDVDRLLSSLVSAGYLSADGEMLVLGPEAERVFGRSNYRELYSVIPGGGEDPGGDTGRRGGGQP